MMISKNGFYLFMGRIPFSMTRKCYPVFGINGPAFQSTCRKSNRPFQDILINVINGGARFGENGSRA